MKKSMFWILSVALIAGMSSCKPSQSAYKAAYEKAQEKPTVAEEIADPEFRPVAPAPQHRLLRYKRLRSVNLRNVSMLWTVMMLCLRNIM